MDSRTILESLIERLRQYKASPLPVDGADGTGAGEDPQREPFRPRRAAVLVCLFVGDGGELRVLLTKRASSLSSHSGEVALPGGKVEEGDADDVATALREAQEEIGLDPMLVTVATCLEPVISKHLLVVVPVVGFLLDKHLFKPVINEAEVEAIFDAPLEMFLKDENRRCVDREMLGKKIILHAFDFQFQERKFLIWGVTAGILIDAAKVIYQRPPAFDEQRPDIKLPLCEQEI